MLHDLIILIATEKDRLAAMSPQDCVDHARYADPTADPLDYWLVKVGYQTTDVSDPAYNAWLLLHAACDRATEIVCMSATECDEDNCYALPDQYLTRVARWKATLAEIVTAQNPMVIAEHSKAVITGLDRHVTERGANHPAVLTAWLEARKAVEQSYPSSVRTWQWKRMSPLERQVAMAR